MDTFLDTFWGGLISSILIEIALSIILWIVAKVKSSSILKAISSSKLFGHGIEYVYSSYDKAKSDIKKDVDISPFVKIMCIRGRSFIQPDEELSVLASTRQTHVKYLLSSPQNPYLKMRANELGHDLDIYIQDVKSNLEQLYNTSRGINNIETRVHNEAPVFRLIILENGIYFSFFVKIKMGKQLSVFRAKSNSIIYKGLNRYFDYVWETSNKYTVTMGGVNNEVITN